MCDPQYGAMYFYTIINSVSYDYPHTVQVYILIINQAIETAHIGNHLLLPMHYCLNSVNTNKIPKLLAKDPNESINT